MSSVQRLNTRTHTHTHRRAGMLCTQDESTLKWLCLTHAHTHTHTHTLLLCKIHDIVFREVKNACSTLQQGALSLCVCVRACACVCAVPWPDSSVKGDLTGPEKILRHTHLSPTLARTHTVLSLHSNLQQNWWAKSSWLYVGGAGGNCGVLSVCAHVCVCWVV